MFTQRPGAFSLRAKIISLVILIVGGILLIFASVSVKVVERALEDDVRERALLVAQGLAAGVYRRQDLEDLPPLRQEMEAVLRSRGSIERIAIFVRRGGRPLSVALSDGVETPGLEEVARRTLSAGEPTAVLRWADGARVWHVAQPMRLRQRVVGAVAVEVSLKQADLLAARQRRQSLAMMGMAALAIVGFLGWYLHRSVNRPIRALVTAMARAEKGDLEAKVDISRQDELGQLALAFNRMLQRVQNFNQELQLKVEEATRDQAERNEELRKLNERLFDIQRELSRSERLAAVGQLAAMVSHEIATPLHSVSGHVQILLQEQTADDRTLNRLRIMESQIGRVVEILERLLGTSRPEERLEAVDVNALLRELSDLTGPAIDQKGVTLSLELESSLPAVRGDPGQLQQVCLNLILNAVEAMPEGGLLTAQTRSLRRTDPTGVSGNGREGDRLVEITVSDTGVGIAPVDLSRIFDPFFTTKGVGQGAGLGLAICRRIVMAHGGSITVESEPGKGSRFAVRLPAAPGKVP